MDFRSRSVFSGIAARAHVLVHALDVLVRLLLIVLDVLHIRLDSSKGFKHFGLGHRVEEQDAAENEGWQARRC